VHSQVAIDTENFAFLNDPKPGTEFDRDEGKDSGAEHLFRAGAGLITGQCPTFTYYSAPETRLVPSVSVRKDRPAPARTSKTVAVDYGTATDPGGLTCNGMPCTTISASTVAGRE
jgi:hypothetical protein